MLARLEEWGTTPARPFRGAVVAHPYPCALDTDMHQEFELGVALSGLQDRHFEGTVVSLVPGDLWLCAAWEPHGWRATAPGTQELVLQFLPDFLGEEEFEGRSWLTMFAVPADARPRVTREEGRADVLAIAQEVRREMQQRRPGWLAAVRLGILRLLLAVSRDWQPHSAARQPALRPGGLERIMPAVRLVSANPAARLGVEEAAAVCGLSVSQFTHTFRRLLGLSYGSFRMRTRLAYAAGQLLTTHHPVEHIAELLGFTDASHLHHAFTKVYGCTPARYRSEGQQVHGIQGHTEVELVTLEGEGTANGLGQD